MTDKRPSESTACWCYSGLDQAQCCAPFLSGEQQAPTALALMRSRFSAYVTHNERYLRETWYPVTCPAELSLDPQRRWLGLKIISTQAGDVGDSEGVVEFVVRYKIDGKGHRLHEVSQFQHVGGRWLYVGGEVSAR